MPGYELPFIGLLFSVCFIALTGLYPGGIIVPGYLVLYMDQPARVAGTLIVAILTLLCYKLASRVFILFGRRRFVFMILTGGVWTLVSVSLFPYIFPVSLEFRVIGWIIPGLIANHFERQGVVVTTCSLVTVTVVTYFAVRFFYRIF
jgi:poly-gamma-glutamate biosynthesis protein PgsC/CapC